MTYVTCPIIRYHPAVVAQKAATLQVLSDGRFILGLGSGENLNEHVTGEGWPPVDQRQEMLVEAATIDPRAAHRGADHLGGRLLPGRLGPDLGRPGRRRADRPSRSPARSRSSRFAPLADHLVAVEPDPELIKDWDEEKGTTTSRKIGQIPICWDTDRDRAVAEGARAVPLVRRRLGGQRRPAHPGRVRGGQPVRPPRRRRRGDPLRPGSRRHRRGGQDVRRCRVHRHRHRPGRRRGPVRVSRRGRRAPAEGLARDLIDLTTRVAPTENLGSHCGCRYPGALADWDP